MYELIKTTTYDEEGYAVQAYGIRCSECSIEEVSCDKGAVLALVSKCNRHNLSPCHLHDIVDDFLNE